MSYFGYVVAAYAVFVVVLGWDFVSTRLQVRRELRHARQRAARERSRQSAASADGRPPELVR